MTTTDPRIFHATYGGRPCTVSRLPGRDRWWWMVYDTDPGYGRMAFDVFETGDLVIGHPVDQPQT